MTETLTIEQIADELKVHVDTARALLAAAREKANLPSGLGGRIQCFGDAYAIEDYLASRAICESGLIVKRCLVNFA